MRERDDNRDEKKQKKTESRPQQESNLCQPREGRLCYRLHHGGITWFDKSDLLG